MPLGKELGLGPGDIVLDGDPQKGQIPPNFRHMSIAVKRLDGSRCAWYGGRPRPWPHCVGWGSSSPNKGHVQHPLHFSAHVYSGETDGWIKMLLGNEVDLAQAT